MANIERSIEMTRIGALALLLLLVVTACGGETGTGGDAEPTGSAPPASTGELIIASGFLPSTLDPVQDAYSFIQFGLAETLTRVTADQQVENWLAEEIEQIDDTTWEVTLRDGVTFWDGSSMTAEDVKSAFERALDEQPAASRYLDPETEIEVIDGLVLRFSLPEPVGPFLNNLATFHLVIYKDGPEGVLMTGPYYPERHTPDAEMELLAYADHWQGPPPIGRILVKVMVDANARMLALQSGEVDLVTEAPPALVQDLPAGLETIVVPSTRYHHIILNHDRFPFNDPAVRRAVNVGIDRGILNDIALDGLGLEMTHLFPPGIGIPTPDEVAFGIEEAEQILDDAGWEAGSDGVRVKDGERLEFRLFSYPRRPELTPIAISIQDQLGHLGFDVEVQQFEDIVSQLQTYDFEASMFSVNMLPIGDPHYALNITLDTYNYGKYENAGLDSLVEQIQVATGSERDDLLLEALEMMNDDTVNLYLIAAPRITVFQSDVVENVTTHPNDLYLIDTLISVK